MIKYMWNQNHPTGSGVWEFGMLCLGCGNYKPEHCDMLLCKVVKVQL